MYGLLPSLGRPYMCVWLGGWGVVGVVSGWSLLSPRQAGWLSLPGGCAYLLLTTCDINDNPGVYCDVD